MLGNAFNPALSYSGHVRHKRNRTGKLRRHHQAAHKQVKVARIPRKTFNLESYRDKIDPRKFEILSRLFGSVSVGLTREDVEEEWDLREE